MSDFLVPTITRRGLAAVVRAQGDGVQATIDRVAIGRGILTAGKWGGYAPSKDATALANETQRVPILSGSRLDPAGFRLLARVPSDSLPTDYAIYEIGFFLSTGELFAIWSSAQYPLAYKTGLADYDFALDLFLEQVPTSALAITVTEPDVPEHGGLIAELIALHARELAGTATRISRKIIDRIR